MLSRRGLVIHPQELDEVWLNNIKEMGLNVLGLHPVGGKDASESLHKMLNEMERLRPLIAKAEKLGITVEFEMHALGYLMPRTQFKEHPDWFCMNDKGERLQDGFNICASNPEGIAELTANTEKLAKELPSKNHLYYFWLDDVKNCRCHCEQCRFLTASDQQMILVNAMLKGIRRADPLGSIAYLAYLDAMDPPVHIKPDAGVFLEYAPFRRNVNRPINDSSCDENVREVASLRSLLNIFGTRNAKVLDYWTDNSMFSQWKYPPKQFTLNSMVMRQDIGFYQSLGFESVTAFGCYLGKEYRDLYGIPELSGYGKAMMQE